MSLQLRSRDGSEYLIQHDSEAIISTWHKAIGEGIQELVSRAWGLQGWWGWDGWPATRRRSLQARAGAGGHILAEYSISREARSKGNIRERASGWNDRLKSEGKTSED